MNVSLIELLKSMSSSMYHKPTGRYIGVIMKDAELAFIDNNKLGIERVQACTRYFANISCSRYVAIATQSVHGLQIGPIVHN